MKRSRIATALAPTILLLPAASGGIAHAAAASSTTPQPGLHVLQPASSDPTEPPPLAQSVLGDYGSAINAIGRDNFSSIYSGDRVNPDGSITIFVGPGDDSALMAGISQIPASQVGDLPASGVLPAVSVVRVPRSAAMLDGQEQAVSNDRVTLQQQGYDVASVIPDYETGVLQVAFDKAPASPTSAVDTTGARLEAATSALSSIAPGVQVTSVNATLPTLFTGNRDTDFSPWYGGDLAYVPAGGCSTGFVVYSGYTGAYGLLSDAHCGIGYFDQTVTGPIGYTVDYAWEGGYDTQVVGPVDGGVTNPYIWGGYPGQSAPPEYKQGGALTSYPPYADNLTYDGAVSGEEQGVVLLNENICENFYSSYLNTTLYVCNLIATTNAGVNGYPAAQPGDSGGPVYGDYYYNSTGLITPVAEIEGGSSAIGGVAYSVFIQPLLSINNAAIPAPPTAPGK
jgi:hypothetical protein